MQSHSRISSAVATTAALCCFLMAASSASASFVVTRANAPNNRPIIGILAEEIAWSLRDRYPEVQPFSHIAASYVKFVEGAGARPAPIWIGRPKEYYEDIMKRINGALFPGGSLWFNSTLGYSEAGRYIYDIARKMNDAGDYFPIWGTCLGYELLGYLAADNKEIRSDCKSHKVSLPLEFTDDFQESRLFGQCPAEVVEILRTKGVTPNFHSYCITEKNMTAFGLDEE